MRYSVTTVATDQGMDLRDLAMAVEDRGLDGLWLPDHTHIPISRRTVYPLGGDLPTRYTRAVDPIVGLAIAAAVTNRIRLGTGIMLVCQRDPLVTAKALATLDHQSGGRLAVGIGYGWNVEEMVDHGVVPSTRRASARERTLAMQRLWEDEVASFSGDFVSFSPSWSWPKPRQQPLPVLVGGGPTATVFAQIAEFANGWIPVGRGVLDSGLPRLRRALEDVGRDPQEAEVVNFVGALREPARLDALEAVGVTEVVFELPPLGADDVLPVLDDLAVLTAERRSH
jgi:probable F420-dependent oxidoreductase